VEKVTPLDVEKVTPLDVEKVMPLGVIEKVMPLGVAAHRDIRGAHSKKPSHTSGCGGLLIVGFTLRKEESRWAVLSTSLAQLVRVSLVDR
jgi:hypothetical protein